MVAVVNEEIRFCIKRGGTAGAAGMLLATLAAFLGCPKSWLTGAF
jgi:hypothetical protein